MASKTIREISGTATAYAADDYVEIDGETNATRKMLLDKIEVQIRNDLTDTELAILDGATVTTTELNILDGCTATYEELNYLAGLTPGTGAVSKAVVLDEDGDGNIARDMSIDRNLQVAGTTGLAGKLTVTGANIEMVSGNIDLGGNELILDDDGDSKIYEESDDVISMDIGGSETYRWDSSAFGCSTAGAKNLGGTLGIGITGSQAFNNLNLEGGIYMKESVAPGAATVGGSCVIYQDSATGDLMVKLRHGGGSNIITLADFA